MRRRRGLLDFLVTAIACLAVYSHTPVGGLIDRIGGWAFDIEGEPRPLTGFFDLEGSGRETPSDSEIEAIIAARGTVDPVLAEQARHFEVSYALLRALTLAGGNIGFELTDDQWAEALRILDGRALPGTRADAPARTVAAALVITHHGSRLGSLDAGVEALLLGSDPVQRAIQRARGDGVEEAARLEGHRRYLTRAQREQAAPVVRQILAIHTALTFVWPIAGKHRVSSTFGERPDPFLGTSRFHNGVDLAVRQGTPVLAAHDGSVRYATYDGVNGHYVKLDHGYGLTTAYCHNQMIDVERHASVNREEVIARSGNSGRSTGPHLHYIVKIGGKPVDPMLFR